MKSLDLTGLMYILVLVANQEDASPTTPNVLSTETKEDIQSILKQYPDLRSLSPTNLRWEYGKLATVIKELLPLDYDRFLFALDNSIFFLKGTKGLHFLVAIAKELSGKSIPDDLLYRMWKNPDRQVTFLQWLLDSPDDLVDFFGVDAVRYFVLHEMPFDNDGVITWELMVERMNSELANTLGNLVNRTISMSNKYFGGVVENKGVTEPVDDDLKSFILSVPAKVDAKMEKLRVADAITEVFTIFKRCNKYIDETMPWALAKDESKQDRLATVLYNLVEGICIGTTLLESFMPDTTKRILGQLNASERTLEDLKTFGLYPSGNKVTDKPEILFARMDIKEVMEKVNELHPPKEEPKEEKPEEKVVDIEAKPEITFDDFAKLQFQVGEVIACEAVKKSKKLLCSQVKIGSQVRQIVSGIKAYYTPEEMVGKKVMVVTNLKPAKLAGILSEGMILCAEDAEGNVCVVSPEKNMPTGSEIC